MRWWMAALVVLLVLGACAAPGTPTPAPTSPIAATPTSTVSPTRTPTLAPAPTPVPTPPPTPGPMASPTPRVLPQLIVHFIDVGQGDATLIDLGQIEVLIDGGRGSQAVNYLNGCACVDGPLEVMVATHPDADHIGGLDSVLEAYQVLEVWLNGDTKDTKTFTGFLAAVKEEGSEVHQARRGDTIHAGAITLAVLHPVDPLDRDANENSIVLLLEYGRVTFLFTGDAESGAESGMVVTGVLWDVDIYKIGHHGSKTASTAPFMTIIKPEVAIYSAKLDNRYGHPHQEAVDRVEAAGATIYGTDTMGTVLVQSDGQVYTVNPAQ